MKKTDDILQRLNEAKNIEIRDDMIPQSLGSIIFKDDCKVLKHIAMGYSCPITCKVCDHAGGYFVDFSVNGNPQKFVTVLKHHSIKEGFSIIERSTLG